MNAGFARLRNDIVGAIIINMLTVVVVAINTTQDGTSGIKT
jgi:hypothetical protein